MTRTPSALTRALRVDADAMLFWVEALRDDNPIHRDPLVVAGLMGKGTINPGPTNLAYVLSLFETAQPTLYPLSIEARFTGNVFAGELVEVAGIFDEAGDCRATLRVPARDETVLTVNIIVET